MHLQFGSSQQGYQNFCHRGKQHNNLPVVMICLQKQCGHLRKCCLTCVDQIHRKHELVSINKFNNYVSEILSHNSMLKNRDQILSLVDDSYNAFKGKLNNLKECFMKRVEKVQNQMGNYFEVIKNSFINQNNQDKLKQLKQQFTDQKVNEIFKITKETQKNLVQSVKTISVSMENTLKLLDNKALLFQKQIDNSITIIDKIIKSFKITGQSKSHSFHFNQETKASCLVINNNKKTVTRGEGTGGYPIVLVNQPFNEINNEIKFRITAEPDKKAMWLGVCVKDIVKNLNYQSCYGLNKGTWAIDQVGVSHVSAYSWSHHDSNFNSAPKVGWQFNLEDIVSIKVDFQKKIVIFKRNDDIYQQPIQTNLGPIYAFAGPTNIGDTYQIV